MSTSSLEDDGRLIKVCYRKRALKLRADVTHASNGMRAVVIRKKCKLLINNDWCVTSVKSFTVFHKDCFNIIPIFNKNRCCNGTVNATAHSNDYGIAHIISFKAGDNIQIACENYSNEMNNKGYIDILRINP